METTIKQVSDGGKIKTILSAINELPREYWAFKGAKREHAHAFIKYPAMMVPQMQRKIISIFVRSFPEIRSVYDPFVGSGTVMTEAMLHGLSFAGQDINPLAVLACVVKKGPFCLKTLKEKVELLRINLNGDEINTIDVNFKGRDKWFSRDVCIALSKIRRAIMAESSKRLRRFFWLAMVETIRNSSNSRTTTFKLHIRTTEDIANRKINPIAYFLNEVNENILRIEEIASVLNERNLMGKYSYKQDVTIKCKNILKGGIFLKKEKLDLLVTSPPYGDNGTTVPYGQYSFLPLQWIDSQDIPVKWNNDYLRTAQEIDRRSLGGSISNKKMVHRIILKKSNSLKELLSTLANDDQGRQYKVASFFYDMDKALKNILLQLAPNAFMVFTLGNRRVANLLVPMNQIMRELLEAQGAIFITEITRDIPSKRMASKNRNSVTMTEESILIMRKRNY